MCAKDTLALKAHLLGDALGGNVLRIGDEVDALEPKSHEGMTREQAQRMRADPPSAGVGGDPVAQPTSVVVHVEAEPDPSDDTTADLDRESLMVRTNLAADESQRIVAGVRRRDRRNPPRDVLVIATGDHRVDVILRPRPQDEIAIPKLHAIECTSLPARELLGRWRPPSGIVAIGNPR